MRWKIHSSIVLLVLLAIGLTPVLHTRAAGGSNKTDAAIHSAIVEIITYNCDSEPSLDGSLPTSLPEGCDDAVFVYSGAIVDSTGIIVTSHMAALADPANSGKLGWQVIGLKQEGEDYPVFPFLAQPIAVDETNGVALLMPVMTMDGDPIKEGDLDLPTVRIEKPGTVKQGDEVSLNGWVMGEQSEDDRMSSIDSTIEDLLSDRTVQELGNSGWMFASEKTCCSLMGGPVINQKGRLVGTSTNTDSDEDGTWIRPMPEALMLMNGEDVSTPADPGATATPETKPRKKTPHEVKEGTATITGRVVSADTSEPIPDALVVILKPGTTVQQVLDNQNPDDIYGGGETDRSGNFIAVPAVQKGEKYSLVILADDYGAAGGDNIELAPVDAGDIVSLGDIPLEAE